MSQEKRIYVGVKFTDGVNQRTYTFYSDFEVELGQHVLVDTVHGFQEAVVMELFDENPLPEHIVIKKVVDKRSKGDENESA